MKQLTYPLKHLSVCLGFFCLVTTSILHANDLSPPSTPVIELLESTPKTTGLSTNPGTSNTMTFDQIQSNGLSNGCYPDIEHYVAEFLYQHPNACFWEANTITQSVSSLPVPTPGSDAVQLPAPSGGDDTNAVQQVINANSGGSVVGNGTYKINGLQINVPIDIFNMSMTPTSGASEIVFVNSPNVRIFNSPIDAQNSSTVSIGYHAKDGSHNFTLINSGLKNVAHTDQKNASGVFLRDVNDFHIACNTFSNITNSTSDSTKTARANAIWMAGGSKKETSGGVIANNVATELQSNGNLDDAEFFTVQSYNKTDSNKPVRIYANRGINAGKRLTKHQESDAVVLSNDYDWQTKYGPLGKRHLYAMVNVHFSSNIVARNNRLKVGAQGKYDFIFIANSKKQGYIPDNIHFDCNDIEIRERQASGGGNVTHIISARNSTMPVTATGAEATNSTANNNYVHGQGSVNYHYRFDAGYRSSGGKFETKGNTILVPFENSEYR